MARKHWAFVSTVVVIAVATCLAAARAGLRSLAKLPSCPARRARNGWRRVREDITYYSISNADLIGAYVKGFTARYPYIRGDFYRGSGNQLVVRTMMEHKSGRLAADVISVGTENVMALKRSGIWTPYRSPEAQFYPREQYKDKDGYFHSDSLGLATMVYNTQLVKKGEAPKGYNDLLDGRWKNSVTIDLEPERAMLAWLSAWGEARTRDFVQKLLANGASVRRGHTLQAQAFAMRRRIQGCRGVYPDAVLRMRQRGCPAEVSFPIPPRRSPAATTA